MAKQNQSPPQPPQPPTNIESLLSTNRRPQPPASPAGAATRSGAAIPATSSGSASSSEEEKEKLFKRTFNLSEENDKQLTQLAYWSHGPEKEKTYHVNKALKEYMARLPKSRKKIAPSSDSDGDE